MEGLCDAEDTLARASQLWTMLDDMAKSNPESYHQFMQQQLKDAKQYYAPAEPYMCLEARILDPTEKSLFVNLCRWNRIPGPQSPSDPVPLRAGKMEEVSDKSEFYSVIDIAYNPSVFEKGKNDRAMKDQLIRLSLKYIEEHYNMTLFHSYTIVKFQLKGSLERMRQSLRREQAPVSQKNLRKEMTLNQLRNIVTKKDSSDRTLLENMVPSKTCLIEEISSTEKPEDLCTPAYEVTTRTDANGKPLKIELKVELPEVHCVSECNLSICKDDVLIECPTKYKLHLDLPWSVNEEATAATFYKRKRVLLISMPVCQ
ncbi:PIH1 domain-containing protein 2 [Rhineura floridana]|uniref:PIH1 domain-containing protein 2 n=1 Tax=Rhineura floridana TaxID=261503 RepID=UPI002AC85168|nr:PIH1 domain-containing protein 2 [Rhineura floridana]XP_061448270.1 PIH1 domain-containing protein 2 [Rhineura floridana]XP_061448271.1 PIH1 domain-containing protein 2 [Rhineura floridana]XP_061448272.1 PIH1 domain-containing protein 2 [Rhineura floridana]XP_061448274.1 PIH1 domain-containing protein 2 [Rhineura floridana]